jgi:hypothetical protein
MEDRSRSPGEVDAALHLGDAAKLAHELPYSCRVG